MLSAKFSECSLTPQFVMSVYSVSLALNYTTLQVYYFIFYLSSMQSSNKIGIKLYMEPKFTKHFLDERVARNKIYRLWSVAV